MKVLSLLTILFFSSITLAQSDVTRFQNETRFDLATEKLIKISGTRRIIIITNTQESFAKGDYVTILVNKVPVVRGIVPKQAKNQSAIKITKIYNEEEYAKMYINLSVQVLRGDDSNYGQISDEESEFRITDEDSLFDDTTLLDEDISEDEKPGGVIKNDNIASVGIGFVDGFNSSGQKDNNLQYRASWGYQVESNIWLEATIGQHLIRDFPASDIDTKVTQLALKAKYAFAGPLNTIFFPYVGYVFGSADSPGAGDTDRSPDPEKELKLVSQTEEGSLVFGATALKRLVPGWFVRIDLGTDVLGASLALEF